MLWERERTAGGAVPALTVLLAGAECPFTCVFCDLWQRTLDGPTPAGAIPAQLEKAVQRAGRIPPASTIKLYNASNFFDDRAVPSSDDHVIARHLAPFARVVVECHPRFIGERCFAFGERINGRLEVALGLETVVPDTFSRLNKGATLADFERVFERLVTAGIGVRAFVLLAPPFEDREPVDAAVHSAARAIASGAKHVTIIPTRAGNGTLEHLERRGAWSPPTLAMLEDALERSLGLGGVVTADLWDAGALITCECGPARLERLGRINVSGRREPAVACPRCGGRA